MTVRLYADIYCKLDSIVPALSVKWILSSIIYDIVHFMHRTGD